MSDEPGVGGDFLSSQGWGPGIGKGKAILHDTSQSQIPQHPCHLIQITINS